MKRRILSLLLAIVMVLFLTPSVAADAAAARIVAVKEQNTEAALPEQKTDDKGTEDAGEASDDEGSEDSPTAFDDDGSEDDEETEHSKASDSEPELLTDTPQSEPEGTVLSTTGGALTSGNYYLASDISLTSAITIAADQTVTVDMNGHVLVQTSTATESIFYNKGTLTVTDSSTDAYNYFTYKSNAKWTLLTNYEPTGNELTLTDMLTQTPVDGVTVIRVTGGAITGGSGSDSSYGGGILNNGTLTVSNVNFISNRVGNYGGAIMSNANLLKLTDCNFVCNSAGSRCGTVCMGGGSLELSGGYFIENVSSTDYAGALFLSCPATVENVVFSKCSSGKEGGAIYATKTLYMKNCTVTGCTGGGNGTYGCIIYGTPAADITLEDCTVSGNTVAKHGALYMKNNKLTLKGKVIISGNTISGSTTPANVYFNSTGSEYLQIDGSLSSGSDIGVTMQSVTGTFLSSHTSTEAAKYFSSDNNTYGVRAIANKTSPETYHYSLEAAYTVTYSIGDGTGTLPEDKTLYFKDDKVTLAAQGDLVRVGYRFNGWNDGTNTYSAGGSYTIGTSNVTLSAVWVEKTAVSITETAQSVTYNGTAQSFAISGNVTSDFKVEYFIAGAWTETAPTNVVTCSVRISRAEDNNYTAYSKEITNGLTINKKSITITASAQTITYGGSISTGKDYVSAQTLAAGDSISAVTLTTTDVNATTSGVITASGASITNGQSDVTDNYTINYATGTLTINPLAVNEPAVTGTYTYTGSVQTPTVTGVETYMNVSGDTSATAAGSYTITYTLDSNHVWASGSDGSVSWSIAMANAQINVNLTPISVTYGDSWALPRATSTFGEVVCDKTLNDMTEAGSYAVKYSVAGTTNYYGDEATLNVTVNPATISRFSVSQSEALTYNGQLQTVSLTRNAATVNNQTATFTYATAAGGTYSTEVPAFTEAGTYTVYYKITAANHNEASGSFNVTIDKKAVSYTLSDTRQAYDGSAKEAIVAFNGLLNNADATVTYQNLYGYTVAAPTAAGSYYIYITLGNSYRFNDSTNGAQRLVGTLTIYVADTGNVVTKQDTAKQDTTKQDTTKQETATTGETAAVSVPRTEEPDNRPFYDEWVEGEEIVVPAVNYTASGQELSKAVVNTAAGTYYVDSVFSDGRRYIFYEEAQEAAIVCVAQEHVSVAVENFQDSLNSIGETSIDVMEVVNELIAGVECFEDGTFTIEGVDEVFTSLEDVMDTVKEMACEMVLDAKSAVLVGDIQGLHHACDDKVVVLEIEVGCVDVDSVTLSDVSNLESVYNGALSSVRYEKSKQFFVSGANAELTELSHNNNYTAESLNQLKDVMQEIAAAISDCEDADTLNALQKRWDEAKGNLRLVSVEAQEDGASVTCSRGLSADSRLVVKPSEELTTEKSLEIAGDYVDIEKFRVCAVYDIELENTEIAEGDSFHLEISVPGGSSPRNRYRVIHLCKDGTTEVLRAKPVNGKLSFDVNSFSPFIIVSHETPSIWWGVGGLALVMLCCAVYAAISKKRED